MCRHGGRYLAPTTEVVALLGGGRLGGDGVALLQVIGLVDLAVDQIGQFVF